MSQLKPTDFQKPLDLAQMEEAVLDFWNQNHIFEKSVSTRPETNSYVFYDGPPFATGMPHYGHLLASTIKDVIPRYWTMKGKRVERIWGWDCHGIPIENMIEKELKLEGGKKGIEAMGIGNFNAACRNEVLRLDKEWEQIIGRLGRWVDFEHNYKTMDKTYMESVWWAFKTLNDKGLVYEGRKVILYCPRCSTPLSNFEIAMDNSYKDKEGPSTVYKYKLTGEDNTYLLAWSTTPWNKLATPALVANPDLIYVRVKQGNNTYILAKNTLSILNQEPYTIESEFIGSSLENTEFELHYDYFPERNGKRAGVVVVDPYVTATEGTGIVTLAVYGEDDYRVMLKHNIQLVEHIDEEGKLKPEIHPWGGMFILKANPLINQDLADRGLIYRNEQRIHSVPVCYRCETPLYQAPIPAWFINIQKIKSQLVASNEKINWYPEHLKHGRFGKGIETAPDWNISRSRYWGTPMPIWRGEKTKKLRVIESISDLKTWAVNPELVEKLTDIHREFIDDLEVWVDDARTEKGKRIPEVFDCWVESGSMPFASEHYPFENKEKFTARHPGQFIAEYIAQTRAWFYTLHVMSVGLFGDHTFENAVTTGTILAEDGAKMSKSKKNYPDPMILINKYGVDSLRLYLMSSVVMKADNLNFSEKAVDEIRKKVFTIFQNVVSFYELNDDGAVTYGFPKEPNDVLDAWLVSITNRLSKEVLASMDAYDVISASRSLMDYVAELSTWYVRRSRERLRNKNPQSLQILRTALRQWCYLMAPLAPFFTESVYQKLPAPQKESIHLELFSTSVSGASDPDLETKMAEIRKVTEKAHALRKEKNSKVRQPLASMTITSPVATPNDALLQVLKDEVNVKKIIWHQADETTVTLDLILTPDLLAEGEAREIIRKIQDARKVAATAVDERIEVVLPSWPQKFQDEIMTKVKADKITKGDTFAIIRRANHA